MSKHDDSVSLEHMLAHALEIRAITAGHTLADLQSNRLLALSTTRLLEILGEAANRISPDARRKYPHIPWAQIIGLRNRLIHGYDVVDFEVIWLIIQDDLPTLISKLESILNS